MTTKNNKNTHVDPPSTAWHMTAKTPLFKSFMRYAHDEGFDVQEKVRQLMSQYVEGKKSAEISQFNPNKNNV